MTVQQYPSLINVRPKPWGGFPITYLSLYEASTVHVVTMPSWADRMRIVSVSPFADSAETPTVELEAILAIAREGDVTIAFMETLMLSPPQGASLLSVMSSSGPSWLTIEPGSQLAFRRINYNALAGFIEVTSFEFWDSNCKAYQGQVDAVR